MPLFNNEWGRGKVEGVTLAMWDRKNPTNNAREEK